MGLGKAGYTTSQPGIKNNFRTFARLSISFEKFLWIWHFKVLFWSLLQSYEGNLGEQVQREATVFR